MTPDSTRPDAPSGTAPPEWWQEAPFLFRLGRSDVRVSAIGGKWLVTDGHRPIGRLFHTRGMAMDFAAEGILFPPAAEPEAEPAPAPAASPSLPSGLILPDGWREEADRLVRDDGLTIEQGLLGLWWTRFPGGMPLATNILLTEALDASARIARRPAPERAA